MRICFVAAVSAPINKYPGCASSDIHNHLRASTRLFNLRGRFPPNLAIWGRGLGYLGGKEPVHFKFQMCSLLTFMTDIIIFLTDIIIWKIPT